jgi:rhodanese-related sulfurtransferase
MSTTTFPIAPLGIQYATLCDEGYRTPEVSTDEMRRILADSSAIVIDSRPQPQFAAGYIPGAVCLDVPTAEQVAAVQRIVNGDSSRPIVIYCNGPHCRQSRRLGDELVAKGFTAVRRYQLGISVWRVLGGPTAVEPEWLEQVLESDETAVLLDVRSAAEFSTGSLPRARSSPVDDLDAETLAPVGMPRDDFNRRVILFGNDAAQARQMAEFLSQRPWANVSYVDGTYAGLAAALAFRS